MTSNSSSSMAFTRLKEAWLQEQFSPDILPYQTELVERHLRAVAEMEERLEGPFESATQQALAHVYEMELERIRYVLRCYLKRRLAKLERLALYVLRARLEHRLSQAEASYVRAYTDLLGAHLHRTFLAQLPEELQSMTDQNMITPPRLDRHVFVKVNETVGDFQLDDSGVETVLFEKGDTYVVRYRSVQELLRTNQVSLI